MIGVGTDPEFGTLYSKTFGPIIKVGDLPVAVKSGTAQIGSEDGSGYQDGGLTNYVYSVVAMVPADKPDFLMYVTTTKPQHFGPLFWQDVVNPVLEEAYLMQDTLTKPVVSDANRQTTYKLPNFVGKNPGETSSELRRNLVQPVVLGTGSKIKKYRISPVKR